MSVQRIPPNLEDRVRVVLAGPGQMRLVLECAICDEEVLVWHSERRGWRCENCEVVTTARELGGLFQDCADALIGEKTAARTDLKSLIGEGLGKWREILLEEMQRRLKGD